ncbi:MAG: HDOD domain-containing protein, partial [Nitrospinae bacterium]|nr:HDOD domain-containing protein [Nitrospinota bacterium]
PSSIINLNSFWRHSIASALIAKFIAEKTNQDKPEKFYIAALLHDIGRLVMCSKIPEITVEILNRSKAEDKLLQIIEIEELGFDHARLGGLLLKQWGFQKFIRRR